MGAFIPKPAVLPTRPVSGAVAQMPSGLKTLDLTGHSHVDDVFLSGLVSNEKCASLCNLFLGGTVITDKS